MASEESAPDGAGREFEVLTHWNGMGGNPCYSVKLRAESAIAACEEGMRQTMELLRVKGLFQSPEIRDVDLMSVLVIKIMTNEQYYTARDAMRSEAIEDEEVAAAEVKKIMEGGGKRGWPSF